MRTIALLALLALVACTAEEQQPEEAAPPAEGETQQTPDSKSSTESKPNPKAESTTTPEAPPAVEPAAPAVDSIPWVTGPEAGFGVAAKDTKNPKGESAMIIYAGYQADLDAAKAWTTALYKADLEARGVRYLYAVQGPRTIEYVDLEIENTKIIETLLPRVTDKTKFILLFGHSSGSYVAHEILRQLSGGNLDPQQKTKDKLVYFNLDGGQAGLPQAAADYARKVFFVSPRDGKTNTGGFNNGLMQNLANRYGGLVPFDAGGAGCNRGATGCIHNSLVVTKPHDPARARPDIDYEDFKDRPVTTAFLTAKAAEAGL